MSKDASEKSTGISRRTLLRYTAATAMAAVGAGVSGVVGSAQEMGRMPGYRLGPVEVIDPARGLVLSNEYVRFEFAPSGMGLKAMVDLSTGKDHIQATSASPTLWELYLGNGTLVQIANNNYKPCSSASLSTLPGQVRRAVMHWDGVWVDKSLGVSVTVDLPPDSGIASWQISVRNQSETYALRSIAFPSVRGAFAPGTYDVARPVFASGGNLLKNVADTVKGRHPSGGWPMQFLSLHQGNDSVYLGTRDPDGRVKDFLADPGKRLTVFHYPENLGVAGSSWPDSYPVEFGVFQGSWLEAARYYRQWAVQQKWASAGRLSQRNVPALATDAAFWVLDERWVWHDPPAGVAPADQMARLNAPLLEAQQQMGVPTALHWYNWSEPKYQYPHFLPARPGVPERIQALLAQGILVVPHINGSAAAKNIPDWDVFAPYAVVDEAGAFSQRVYSATAGPLVTMCPTQTSWQDTIATLVGSMVTGLAFNGVYLDQVSALEPAFCFQKEHGHPLGGGRHWTDGYRELLREVRSIAGGAVTITSEGFNEMFCDLIDASLTWAEPSDFEIPLMQVVYSGYTLLFGSPCDYGQSDRFFRYAQGQALIDGRQNGWMSVNLFGAGREQKVEFLRECVRVRAAYGKYLTYGRLIEPVLPLDPVPTFTEDVFGWAKKHRGSVPVAEARLWQAEDGAVAIFFANYGDEQVAFRYRIHPALLRRDLNPSGRKFPPSLLHSPFERTETLEPASVMAIELPPWGETGIQD